MGKYAHFEKIEPTKLQDLYMRHGEVAREIFRDKLRELTGDPNIEVDLKKMSFHDPGASELDEMGNYEVISGSSELSESMRANSGINESRYNYYKKYLKEHSAEFPIVVSAAGNEGSSGRTWKPRFEDFARNSVVVGEANFTKGAPYIEEHSNTKRITLASDNPINRGKKYQLYDTKPSLEGHEDLVKEWLLNRKADEIYGNNIGEGELGDLDIDRTPDNEEYTEIIEGLQSTGYMESEELNSKLSHYMNNPEELHTQVMAELREGKDIDEKGFTSDFDGTSFSTPEMAAYMAYGVEMQERREGLGLPILSKDEITTISKMATVDTTLREGNDGLLKLFNNEAGNATSMPGGHGVFYPETFEKLLDKSYDIMGSDPDIDRTSEVLELEPDDINKGSNSVNYNLSTLERPDFMIDKVRFDMVINDEQKEGFKDLNWATVSRESEEYHPEPVQDVVYPSYNLFHMGDKSAWIVHEQSLGETLADDKNFNVTLPRGTSIESASATLYGYNKGGLINQVMDYSQELQQKFQPSPEEVLQTAEELNISTDTGSSVKAPTGSM